MRMNDRARDLQVEDKANRMLEMYARQSFRTQRSAYQVHLKVVAWAIRVKVWAGVKRGFDLCFALIALIVTAPVFLITAAAIRLDSPGPVFFRQTRVGRGSRQFGCYKFRSMHTSAEHLRMQLAEQNEADGPIFKIRRDPTHNARGPDHPQDQHRRAATTGQCAER